MRHTIVFTPFGEEGPTKAIGPFDSKEDAVKFLQGVGAEQAADHRMPDTLWYDNTSDEDGRWNAYEIVPLEKP